MSGKKKRLALLFSKIRNVNLKQDPGMIPAFLARNHGYESWLVGYQMEESYPYAAMIPEVKLVFIANRGNVERDYVDFLSEQAEHIDILMLFGLHEQRSISLANVYRQRNPHGKVYFKLDADAHIFELHVSDAYFFAARAGFISVESREICTRLNQEWPIQVGYVPDGVDFPADEPAVSFEQKQNIILTVARLGTEQKATDVLLTAVQEAHQQLPGWRVRLVGSVAEAFRSYIESYFSRYPEMRDCVEFVGEIVDNAKLAAEYQRAKIFCLPSRWESFGIVSAEAGKYGCYVVATDLSAQRDIVDGGQYGTLVPVDDAAALAAALVAVAQDEGRLRRVCAEFPAHIRERFSYQRIAAQLAQHLAAMPEPLTVDEFMDGYDVVLKKVYAAMVDGQYELALGRLLQGLQSWPDGVWAERGGGLWRLMIYGKNLPEQDGVALELLRQVLQGAMLRAIAEGMLISINALVYLADEFRVRKPAPVRTALQEQLSQQWRESVRRLTGRQQWKEAGDSLAGLEMLGLLHTQGDFLLAAEIYRRNGQSEKALAAYRQALDLKVVLPE